MMINANSMAHLREQLGQYPQAVQSQKHLLTDRANPRDLRQDVHDDLYHMRITQSGNLGMKQALGGVGETDIRHDLKQLRTTHQAPSPIDVTA
jgi:hypothetical protein